MSAPADRNGLYALLSDEHVQIRDMANEFAQTRIAPNAEKWNRDKHVSVETLREMADLGLLGLLAPEEFGGAGLGMTAFCLVMEEISAADVGTSVSLATQLSLTIAPLVNFGTEEQKQRWLPDLVSGARFGCYNLTEPNAGSDTASLRTTAVEDDDGWSISGTKTWISNGGFADLFIVFARTDGPGAKGVSAFVVDAGEGLTASREIPKMGLHSSSTAEIAFDGVRAESDQMLGERGAGLSVALATLDSGRIVIAAQAVGIARAALELAIGYATEREAFGGPIARFQGVQFPIAEIAARIDAARLLTLHAACVRDSGAPVNEIGAKAKLLASQVAVDAADMAVQTLGGYGYSAEFAAERLYRDARITKLYEGTSEIQRMVISRSLMGSAARS